MPIEIRELHIKVNVEENPPGRQVPSGKRSSNDKESIINACVEKVLEVLKQEDRR